jgi:hypothetical protein
MPIPKVQITILNSTASFNVISDDDGKFEIDLPPGKYQVRSDKLPGFAATNRELTIETKKAAEVTIVPAISTEGVLCILTITAKATTKRPKRKKPRRSSASNKSLDRSAGSVFFMLSV